LEKAVSKPDWVVEDCATRSNSSFEVATSEDALEVYIHQYFDLRVLAGHYALEFVSAKPRLGGVWAKVGRIAFPYQIDPIDPRDVAVTVVCQSDRPQPLGALKVFAIADEETYLRVEPWKPGNNINPIPYPESFPVWISTGQVYSRPRSFLPVVGRSFGYDYQAMWRRSHTISYLTFQMSEHGTEFDSMEIRMLRLAQWERSTWI
jgi:hypothetical protein